MSNPEHKAKITPSYGTDPGRPGTQGLRRVAYRAHCERCGWLSPKTSYRYVNEYVRRHNLDGWTPTR